MLLDRGDTRVALEIKAGSGRGVYLAHSVAAAARDAKTGSARIIDQAREETLFPSGVRARNFGDDLRWIAP